MNIAVGGEIPPRMGFEQLNEDDSQFEFIKIQGYEYEQFKRINGNKAPIPELFLFAEFTFTKFHTERLLKEFGKYLGKGVEVMYIDGYVSKGVLKITEPNPWFDDITKLGNQIVVEGQHTRDYVSYDRIMHEGVYIRVMDDLNGLKESVSGKINNVFNH